MLTANGILWLLLGTFWFWSTSYEAGQGKGTPEGRAAGVVIALAAVLWGIVCLIAA